jgi:hypothetical protein
MVAMFSQLNYADVPLYKCNAYAIVVKGVGFDWIQVDPDRVLLV